MEMEISPSKAVRPMMPAKPTVCQRDQRRPAAGHTAIPLSRPHVSRVSLQQCPTWSHTPHSTGWYCSSSESAPSAGWSWLPRLRRRLPLPAGRGCTILAVSTLQQLTECGCREKSERRSDRCSAAPLAAACRLRLHRPGGVHPAAVNEVWLQKRADLVAILSHLPLPGNLNCTASWILPAPGAIQGLAIVLGPDIRLDMQTGFSCSDKVQNRPSAVAHWQHTVNICSSCTAGLDII